jgi:hypothetical protein
MREQFSSLWNRQKCSVAGQGTPHILHIYTPTHCYLYIATYTKVCRYTYAYSSLASCFTIAHSLSARSASPSSRPCTACGPMNRAQLIPTTYQQNIKLFIISYGVRYNVYVLVGRAGKRETYVNTSVGRSQEALDNLPQLRLHHLSPRDTRGGGSLRERPTTERGEQRAPKMIAQYC